MSDQPIRHMVEQLLGQDAPHLGDSIATAIGGRMRSSAPPRALVLRLDRVRAHSGGLHREVTVLASTEVYL